MMQTEYDIAVERLSNALDQLEVGSPEYWALWPEYDQAFKAWHEYHETECPICRRTDATLKAIAEADPDHITCPHCAGQLPLDGRLPGDRIHCARCNNWVLLARFTSGVWYGVKVGPPPTKVYKQVQKEGE